METFSTSGDPEWITQAKNDTSQLKNKLYLKSFKENQNGFMAPLQSKPALSTIKINSGRAT